MALRHPNIVSILSTAKDPASKQYYIVMEFVEGGNLRDFLVIRKKLGAAEALRVLEEAVAGLAHAFSRGVTHRDMKPTNILISAQGAAKLVDFGLAGITHGAAPADAADGDDQVDRSVDYAGLETRHQRQAGRRPQRHLLPRLRPLRNDHRTPAAGDDQGPAYPPAERAVLERAADDARGGGWTAGGVRASGADDVARSAAALSESESVAGRSACGAQGRRRDDLEHGVGRVSLREDARLRACVPFHRTASADR